MGSPIEILENCSKKLKSGGKIVLEIPHANDFLVTHLNSQSFKQFTLWSQHLILHTRQSIYKMLEFVGYKNIFIKGIQSYSLANHLHWLTNNSPGGHLSKLAIIESSELTSAYENALSSIDANDTLICVGEKDNCLA